MRQAPRAFLLAAVATLLAVPSFAGVIYLPALARDSSDGYEKTVRVVVSNPDSSVARAIGLRYIAQGVAGTPLPPASVAAYWVGPGASRTVFPVLPADGAGLLELSPGYPGILASAELVYVRPGGLRSIAPLPAVGSREARTAGDPIHLQGLERSSAGARTDLFVFNLGTTPANCSITVRAAGGLAVPGIALPGPVAPISSIFRPDALAPAGEVPPDSRATIVCDRTFFAFAVRHHRFQGGIRVLLPTAELEQSGLTQPGGQSTGTVVYELPGTYLICTPNNHDWKRDLTFGGATRDFRRVEVDFDVFVAGWDPSDKKIHQLLWVNDGSRWQEMLGYLNAVEGQNKMRFAVFQGFGQLQSVDDSPGVQPGSSYHVRYDFDAVTGRASYRITDSTGAPRVDGAIQDPTPLGRFSTSRVQIAQGTWLSEGPEARTYDWRFSNLRVVLRP
jgi:hypothetical protein